MIQGKYSQKQFSIYDQSKIVEEDYIPEILKDEVEKNIQEIRKEKSAGKDAISPDVVKSLR